MASPTSLSERLGASPAKLALIAALAVVLIGVLYMQYGRRSVAETASPGREAAPPSSRRPPGTMASPSGSTDDGRTSAGERLEDPLWESPDLAQVVAYDPFALPADFPQPSRPAVESIGATGVASTGTSEDPWASVVENLQLQLDELRQRGVRIVINRQEQYVAMIGDQTVRVGDEINGFTVTAIDPDGVRVERKIQ